MKQVKVRSFTRKARDKNEMSPNNKKAVLERWARYYKRTGQMGKYNQKLREIEALK